MIKSGETRTLDIVIGVELEGKLVLLTCVLGKEEPFPIAIRVGVLTGVEEDRLPG